jgi:hypothetical protein
LLLTDEVVRDKKTHILLYYQHTVKLLIKSFMTAVGFVVFGEVAIIAEVQ